MGSSSTLVIVGLGNTGKQYDNTRHNIGFAVVDALHDAQAEFEPWQEKKNLFAQIASGSFGSTKVILVKPQTYMNDSGKSVRAVLDFYKLPLEKTLVVHDELDIPFGQIRTRIGGGSAGHNGIKSIMTHLGDNFGRLRIGIEGDRPEAMDGADYVLGRFSKSEMEQMTPLLREAQSILIEYIYRGELYADTRSFLI